MIFARNMSRGHRIFYAICGICLIVAPVIWSMRWWLGAACVAFGAIALTEAAVSY